VECFDEFLEEQIKEAIKDQPEINYEDLNIKKIKGNLYSELTRHVSNYSFHYREIILSSI